MIKDRRLIEFAVPGVGDIYSIFGALDFRTKQKAKDYEKEVKLYGGILLAREGGDRIVVHPEQIFLMFSNSIHLMIVRSSTYSTYDVY